MTDRYLRFDLLECRHCGERTFTIDKTPVSEQPDWGCEHQWWSRFQFFAKDNGPGLHPTQTRA